MSKAGCKLFAICSQKQAIVNKAIKQWKIRSFDGVIGDPENRLAWKFKNNDELMPELEITDCSAMTAYHPFLTPKNYPYGACQAAIFFLVGQKPVLAWSKQQLTFKNLHGSLERPTPSLAWKEVMTMKEHVDRDAIIQVSDGQDIPVTMTYKDVCSVM